MLIESFLGQVTLVINSRYLDTVFITCTNVGFKFYYQNHQIFGFFGNKIWNLRSFLLGNDFSKWYHLLSLIIINPNVWIMIVIYKYEQTVIYKLFAYNQLFGKSL